MLALSLEQLMNQRVLRIVHFRLIETEDDFIPFVAIHDGNGVNQNLIKRQDTIQHQVDAIHHVSDILVLQIIRVIGKIHNDIFIIIKIVDADDKGHLFMSMSDLCPPRHDVTQRSFSLKLIKCQNNVI